MAIEPEQSLLDLAARTATADSDFIHVNSGGSDYKQTKQNFTADLAKEISFSTSSTLTSQIDALSPGAYYGFILSYGHQTATGMPYDVNFFVNVQKYDSNNCTVHAIARGTNPRKWTINKANSWGSWIEDPSRDEITSLNNSLTQLILTGSASVSNPITSAAAGATGHFTVTVPTPSGYTLVGVIGYEGSGTGGFSYSDIYKTSNTSVEVYYRNNNSTAKSITLWKAYVLYVKTL